MCHPEAATEHTASPSVKCARDVGRGQGERRVTEKHAGRSRRHGERGGGGPGVFRSRACEEWGVAFQRKQCFILKEVLGFFLNLNEIF